MLTTDRNPVVSRVKGIAIILVVTGHSLPYDNWFPDCCPLSSHIDKASYNASTKVIKIIKNNSEIISFLRFPMTFAVVAIHCMGSVKTQIDWSHLTGIDYYYLMKVACSGVTEPVT